MRVECHGVGKTFGEGPARVEAVRDVSLEASGHEFVGIVGPSGCGKTTLLRMVAGLVTPSSGRVVLDGVLEGRPASAMVFQEHGIFPWLTVLENVAFGLEMQGVEKEERLERARLLIARVGLEAFADSFPSQLSVGMRQRVGIIRAFATEPSLLLMDEPFGALDSQTRRVLQGELLKLWWERRGLVLFVTHDIDEAVRLSDRILVLSGRPGTIREEIAVPLARPRQAADREPREIADLKWHIWRLLESEVRASLGVVR